MITCSVAVSLKNVSSAVDSETAAPTERGNPVEAAHEVQVAVLLRRLRGRIQDLTDNLIADLRTRWLSVIRSKAGGQQQ